MVENILRGAFEGIRKRRKSMNLSASVLLICTMVLAAGIVSCANTGEETIDTEEGPPQRSGGTWLVASL